MFCLVTFQPWRIILSHSKSADKSKNWEICSPLPLIPGLSPSHWQITATSTPQHLLRHSKSSRERKKIKGSHHWESTSAEDWQNSVCLYANSSHGICPWIQGHSLEGVNLPAMGMSSHAGCCIPCLTMTPLRREELGLVITTALTRQQERLISW